MKFFDRKREFVYFSDLDARINTTHHYDVFTYSSEEFERSAEYVGTFAKKKYARAFCLLPRVHTAIRRAGEIARKLNKTCDPESVQSNEIFDLNVILGALEIDIECALSIKDLDDGESI